MAKKKESVVKSVGRFVTNELLGVDDAKRAIKYASKGQFKKAAKSAGTAVLEAGTTVSGAGLGAKVGAKIGLKAGQVTAKKAAFRAGESAGRSKAEQLGAAKYGSKGGKKKSVRANSNENVTVSRKNSKTIVTTTSPKKIKYTTPERTDAQRLGTQKAGQTNRNNKIEQARYDAAQASYSTSRAPSTGKKIGKTVGGAAGITAVASTKKIDKPLPKKKSK